MPPVEVRGDRVDLALELALVVREGVPLLGDGFLVEGERLEFGPVFAIFVLRVLLAMLNKLLALIDLGLLLLDLNN